MYSRLTTAAALMGAASMGIAQASGVLDPEATLVWAPYALAVTCGAIPSVYLFKAWRRAHRRAERLKGYLTSAPDALFVMREENLVQVSMPANFPGSQDEVQREHVLQAIVHHYRAVRALESPAPALPIESSFDVALDGVTVSMELRIIRGPSCAADMLMVRNVTQEQAARRTVEYLATHDALTGLPNRYLFNEHLVQSLKLARRHARTPLIGFVDLNDFKAINDNFGHAAGDAALKEIAHRLSSGLREADLVARMSGDEFVFIFDDISDVAAARGRIERVVARISEPIDLGPGLPAHRTHAAVGIALYGEDGLNADELLHAADKAMYRNKAMVKAVRSLNETTPKEPVHE